MTAAQIAAQIAAIARNRNLTQAAISEKSGVPQGTISRVFSGKCLANIETLCRLAEAVGAEILLKIKNAEQ